MYYNSKTNYDDYHPKPYICVYVHACMYVCVCMYACILVCMCVCKCMCVYMNVYVCLCVYLCIYMYVCIFFSLFLPLATLESLPLDTDHIIFNCLLLSVFSDHHRPFCSSSLLSSVFCSFAFVVMSALVRYVNLITNKKKIKYKN